MRLFIALQILTNVVIPRRIAQLKAGNERGSVTLEQAFIAGGLFLLAVGVVAAIKYAVDLSTAKVTGGG